MKILSLSISDGWSFSRKTPGCFEFDSDVTTIIGKNNSGKSNVFSALRWALSSAGPKDELTMARKETYEYGEDGITAEPEIIFRLSLSPEEITEFLIEGLKIDSDDEKLEVLRDSFSKEQEIVFSFRARDSNAVRLGVKWDPLMKGTKGGPSTTLPQDQIQKFRTWTQGRLTNSIIHLDCWRSLKTPLPEGKTVVQVLHAMQGPDTNSPWLVRDFEKVEELFVGLTGLTGARLRIRADGGELNVSYRGRYLSIESFGDGVIHTLLMAIEFIRRRETLFLIEEPETHLHPELIRLLLKAVESDTNGNQFVFTSHSPVLLDGIEGQTIYSIEYQEDFSTVKRCNRNSDFHRILDLLDVRLSDVLQANCVVWVEGPSDRMFLKRCLELLASDLREGQHFQIAFYGGALLAHCSVGVTDGNLVDLLKLCRHAVIVADSDSNEEDSQLNETKARVRESVSEMGGIFWLTEGREIENYLSDRVLNDAYAELLPEHSSGRITLSKFDRLEEAIRTQFPSAGHGDKWKVDYSSNKTRLMPVFMKKFLKSDTKYLDLGDRLNELIDYIRGVNRSHTY